jgi:signal transduction histidine kinase
MRTLLMEMRPAALAEASLPRLLELLAAAAEGGSRVAVHVDVRGAARLPEHVNVALFRTAQEALQNMSRHSGAGEAWVMLDTTGSVIRLSVRDDGRGFDVAAVPPEHLGLRMMREHAEDAGIRVAVESAPGAGTTVTATWRAEDVEA